MQYKNFKFNLQEAEEASGSFIGYAGTTKKDSDGDVIVTGAYAKTLAENQGGFPLLWMHQVSTPVGLVTELVEDEKGLLMTGQVDLDTVKGREVFSGMRKGYISNFSVGFRAIKHDHDPATDTRFIREVKLYEISAVTKGFSANDAAELLGVKSLAEQLEVLQSIDPADIDEQQIKSTITHLQTLLRQEPDNSTPTVQPEISTETAALMKRLQDAWTRK